MSRSRGGRMLEIRPFTGTPEDLGDFVTGVWKQTYHGRMTMPDWTAEYFDWQLPSAPEARRDAVVAAYEGDRLAGVIIACPYEFQTSEGLVPGALSSWLSIAEEHRGQGLVGRLKDEQAARIRSAGGRMITAYRYVGSRRSLSRPLRERELASGEWACRKTGFWVRVLDSGRASRWHLDPLARTVTAVGAPFTSRPRERTCPSHELRPFADGDAASAAEVLAAADASRSLAIRWTAETLDRHCRGFGRCVAAVRDGRVEGLLAWHELTFFGRTADTVAVIDLVETQQLPAAARRALIDSALARMRSAGAVLALKIRTGDCDPFAMVAAGFIPWFRDSHLVVRWLDGPAPPGLLRGTQQVLWR
ncbi:MAG: GNAT family N-acetyltransferase [Planctomyces sp.]|nr:GNAT family N-acetyltransferase [Planctomyces sp.]